MRPQLSFQHQALVQLSRFPMDQLWRFAVDGKLQIKEKGWESYDKREPGSVSALIRGLAHALKQLNKPITVELVKQLHIICGTGVTFDHDVRLGIFNNRGVYVQILPEVSTPEGFRQFLYHPPRHGIQGVLFITAESAKLPHKGGALVHSITVPLNYFTKGECPCCPTKFTQFKKFLTKEWRILYYPPKSLSPDMQETVQTILAKDHCPEGYVEKTMKEHVQDVLNTYKHEQKTLTKPTELSKSGMLATQ